MNWYALFVSTGREEFVQHMLNRYFDEYTFSTLVPKRRVPEKRKGSITHVNKLLFPGYVLIKTDMNATIYHKIKKIPKCISLLNHGPHYSCKDGTYFSKIDTEEIKPVLQLLDHDDTIHFSTIWVKNSKVSVISGPLTGKEKLIRKVNLHKRRAKILLRFLEKEVCFEVGIKVLSNTPKEG